jgi:hypothetical protein
VSPNDNFRRELNNAMDDVSGAPSSNLRDRVRSAVAEAQPDRSTYWIAAVAACVITALIVGILYVNNPFRRPVGTVNPGGTPSPSASPSTEPTPSPSPSSSPTAAFVCTASTMEHTLPVGAPTTYVDAFRKGSHPGYDQITVEFSNGIPGQSVEIKPQVGTKFTMDASGQTVTLKGTNGILVTITGADMHTMFHGTVNSVTGYPAMAEIRQLGDYEGVVTLGLGIQGPACYQASYLTDPYRLVIKVQSAS